MRKSIPEYAQLPVGKLLVDHEYQRGLKEGFVKKLVKMWDDSACQPLTIHLKNDGEYHVVDGQHRLAACKILGKRSVPCLVTLSEDQADEARTFVAVNTNRQGMTGVDIFRAKVVAEDSEALAIAAILERNKMSVKDGPTSNGIMAASSLVKAYQAYGPESLEYALRTLQKAYGGETGTIVGFMIVAIARFYSRYNKIKNFDPDRLPKVLAPVPLADFRRRTSARSARGILNAEGSAYVLVDIYNSRLTEANRLDSILLGQSASNRTGWEKMTEKQREDAKERLRNVWTGKTADERKAATANATKVSAARRKKATAKKKTVKKR